MAEDREREISVSIHKYAAKNTDIIGQDLREHLTIDCDFLAIGG
jgi:hypothetical protein